MASPRRPSSPTITASILLQQQLSLSFSHPWVGCFGSGLPERPAASGTALGEQASILLRISQAPPASLSHLHACLPSHSTAAPWLCRTSPRCLWCVCVSVCAHVCRTWCCLLVTPVLRGHGWVGMWPVGRGLQGRPRCMSDTVQLGFQVTERALGSFLSPCQFCRPRHSPVGISPHCSSPKPRRGCSSRPRVPGRRQLGHQGQAAHQTGDFYPHDPF